MKEELSVEITAKIDKLKKGISQSEKEINSLGKKAGKFNQSFDRSMGNSAKSMTKFSKSTANGSSAMLAFSRTVQDAPFGIMGVSNNITNLTEQFGALKNRTGSAGSALKLMLRDLKGFGGITLGISVVTSLLVAFGDKIFSAKKKTDEFAKAISNVSTKSIIEFKTLAGVLTDTTASQREQSKAVEILKKKYSDFDVSILTTKGNYEKGKIAIDNYINSLVQQAKAQAALTLIQEKQSKILQLEEERFAKIRAKGFKDEKEFNDKIISEQKRVDGITSQRKKSQQSAELNTLNRIKETNKKELDELKSQITNLTKLANIKDFILFGDRKATPKNFSFGTALDTSGLFKGISDVSGGVDIDLADKVTPQFNAFNSKLLEMQQTAMLVNQSISNSFDRLGSAISNSLGNSLGVFGVFVGEIVRSMFNLLANEVIFTKKKIALDQIQAKSSTITAAANTAAKTPFGAFILPALITAGTAAITSAFSGIGSVSNDTNTGGFNNSGLSRSFGGNPSSGGNIIKLVADGNDLVAAIRGTLDRQYNLGGSTII